MTRLLTLVALLALAAVSLAVVASAKDKSRPALHELQIVKVVDKASPELYDSSK
jgi:type VI protein secretion system component Hcp